MAPQQGILVTAHELGLSRYLVKLDKATGTARLCKVQAVEVVPDEGHIVRSYAQLDVED